MASASQLRTLKVLLHLMSGSKEDTETVRAFFQDMRARGLGDPILVHRLSLIHI